MRINPKALMGLAAVTMPVGVLIAEHVSWQTTPQAKKRMLTHQLTFWGMMAVGVMLMHRAFFKPGLSTAGRFVRVLAGGLVATPAFVVGEWLSNRLFPHQPQPLPEPAMPVLTPRISAPPLPVATPPRPAPLQATMPAYSTVTGPNPFVAPPPPFAPPPTLVAPYGFTPYGPATHPVLPVAP